MSTTGKEILQSRLPHDPPGPRLPGIQPMPLGEWLQQDDAYGAQMRRRVQLLKERRADVLAMLPGAAPLADELLDLVLEQLAGQAGFDVKEQHVLCPDGRRVPVERADPLATLGHLVQEDFCILDKQGGEHVMCAALLCFPAGWTLAEKIGRPLGFIHGPVADYDGDMARRVQRLFDAIRPEQPLWRANLLAYDDAELFAPRSQHAPRPPASADAPYLRSERQYLVRLPRSRAVVFSIHTYVLRRENLSERQKCLFGDRA